MKFNQYTILLRISKTTENFREESDNERMSKSGSHE